MNPKNKSSNVAQAKKPLYKHWWFWAIIIVVFGLIAAVSQPENSDDPSTTTPTENSENTDTNDESSSSNDISSDQTEGTSSAENAGGYKVGETMVFKDRKVTVTSVERNFSTGNDYNSPEEGKEFVKIDITVTNTSTSNLHTYAGDWKMQDSNGVINTYDLMATSAVKNALDMSVELAGGGQVSGALVFEVPKDDNNLQLQYKASFLNTVIIKL